MFSQNEIDAALREAQSAVDDLSRDVAGHTGSSADDAAVGGNPGASPQSRTATSDELRRILELKVPVRVRLAQRAMPIDDILRIAPGSIVEFEQNVEEELALMVNNRQMGRGVAVKVNEHFGIRITSIGDVASRIRSMSA